MNILIAEEDVQMENLPRAGLAEISVHTENKEIKNDV